MACRSVDIMSDAGRKYEWSKWTCADDITCPQYTVLDEDSIERDNGTGTRTDYEGRCVDVPVFGWYANRQRGVCRWTKDKYDKEGYASSADKILPCCTGDKNGTTDAECHPDYCEGNTKCNDWMNNYCSVGDNI